MIRVISKSRPEDPTMWLFHSLWDDQQLFLLGLPSLMDEIEHVLETDPTEKSRISSWVAGVFSDLGLIARLQHELEIYQPWAATFDPYNLWAQTSALLRRIHGCLGKAFR